jgi:hypothetical protein
VLIDVRVRRTLASRVGAKALVRRSNAERELLAQASQPLRCGLRRCTLGYRTVHDARGGATENGERMLEDVQTYPQSPTMGRDSERRVRLILENGGQVCVGLQRPADAEEVILTISDLAAIADLLDQLRETGGTSWHPCRRFP